MSTPDLNALLNGRRVKAPRKNVYGLSPEVQADRQREQTRRHSQASGLALTALRRLYPDEYHSLLQQAQDLVNSENGPLPGDEVAS